MSIGGLFVSADRAGANRKAFGVKQDRDADHARQCGIVMRITVKLNRWPILATRIDATR
jgi:hypothetical protein